MVFTTPNQYPNLFGFGRNAEVFYVEGTSTPFEFVDLQSGAFFDLD